MIILLTSGSVLMEVWLKPGIIPNNAVLRNGHLHHWGIMFWVLCDSCPITG